MCHQVKEKKMCARLTYRYVLDSQTKNYFDQIDKDRSTPIIQNR